MTETTHKALEALQRIADYAPLGGHECNKCSDTDAKDLAKEARNAIPQLEALLRERDDLLHSFKWLRDWADGKLRNYGGQS